MRIAHFAPFAPNRCGLYEAARDCARADALRDHDVIFVDTGVVQNGFERSKPVVGGVDARGGWILETAAPERALQADLFVCHDGVPDSLTARCQAPMVWMIHGRPLACFRPEQNGAVGRSFSIVGELAAWPRVKSLVTMWAEHEAAWRMVAGDKLRCTVDPPVDLDRFKPSGRARTLTKPGKVNVLIADSWREDVDIYEVTVGAWLAATSRPDLGLKVHFWAVEESKQNAPCWQQVWRALDQAGALGEIHGREPDFQEVYRAMDLLLSPHTIGVRTITEALACGLPVVAGRGCRYATACAPASDAEESADALIRASERRARTDPSKAREAEREEAARFGLDVFGARMEAIYEEAVRGSLQEAIS